MSRGPGRWQRAIVKELATRPAFYLVDLLPTDYTRSEYAALWRAARSLEERREVVITRYRYGSRKVLVSLAPPNPTERPSGYGPCGRPS